MFLRVRKNVLTSTSMHKQVKGSTLQWMDASVKAAVAAWWGTKLAALLVHAGMAKK
jgi:hypothetical protein